MKNILCLGLLFCLTFLHVNGQAIPELETDSLKFRSIHIPLEISISCEQQKYQLSWFTEQLDSADLPKQLLFKGYRYDEGDTNKIAYRTVRIDSAQLYGSPYIWIGSPGFYYLEFIDSSKRIIYSSDQVLIELCARFQLPDKYTIHTGKYLKPLYSQNIERIDLVIFDAQGDEVFSTKDPNFKWDGRHQETGEPCLPGSYFYHCDIVERKAGMPVKKNITGIIELSH